jgi:hypothetical protein
MGVPGGYTDSYSPEPGGETYQTSRPAYASVSTIGDGGSGTFTLVMVGIILLMVGGVVRSITWLLDGDGIEVMMTIIDIFAFLGAAIISLGLFHGGITKSSQSDMVRLGMLISGGIIVGLMASNMNPLASIFSGIF